MSAVAETVVKQGEQLPDFALHGTGALQTTLSGLRGRNVVLYFYPKDDTPGCTTEGQDFTAMHADVLREDTVILGVSRDSLASHEKFKAKYEFAFELVTDSEEELCTLFDVIKPKNMYGRQYTGIERSTFLIDREGVLKKEWRKVKVKGHVAEVLEAVKALS